MDPLKTYHQVEDSVMVPSCALHGHEFDEENTDPLYLYCIHCGIAYDDEFRRTHHG